jgi:hypothetical protein
LDATKARLDADLTRINAAITKYDADQAATAGGLYDAVAGQIAGK